MNAQNFAHTAYSRPQAPTRSARSVEYELLARITQQLRSTSLRRADNFAEFAGAISDNIRLWATFAADVAETGNGLPPELRAKLFYLYQFTEVQSSKILADKGEVTVLIDINTAVMRGLRGNTGGAA